MSLARILFGFNSQSVDPVNIAVPWQNSTQDGLFRMNYSDEKAIETNLRVWAKTNRGERPMRFDFGLDARRMLFEPELITKDALKSRAREQLNRFFGFLRIDNLEVLTSEDVVDLADNTVRFILEVTFKNKEDKKIKISEEIGA